MAQDTLILDNDKGDWDKTIILLNNPEVLVIYQYDDEANERHEVHLSPRMASELLDALTQWVGTNNPPA